jgi:hypothetical protein
MTLQTPDFSKLALAEIACYTDYSAVDDDDGTLIALHMVGYEQAVKSNWAKLVTAKTCYNHINGCLVITEGARDHVTMKTMLPESGWLDMWLIHKQVTTEYVNPSRKPHFYTFVPEHEPEATNKLQRQFVALLDRAISLPVLPAWTEYLWQQGDIRGLIHAIHPGDCRNLIVYRIKTTLPIWTSIISTGLKEGDISF